MKHHQPVVWLHLMQAASAVTAMKVMTRVKRSFFMVDLLSARSAWRSKSDTQGVVFGVPITPLAGSQGDGDRGEGCIRAVAHGHRLRCRVQRACTADDRHCGGPFSHIAFGCADAGESDFS